MAAVSRLGDSSSHGGTIISASSDIFADGIPVARTGDLHQCPLDGHGITPLTSILSDVNGDNKDIITVGATAGCGAVITTGSSDVNAI